MNKYDAPKDEEMVFGHFKSTKGIKKSLREWMFFENGKRLFINVDLIGQNGLLCAMCDGISMIRYDEKKSPCFIDSQWVIDEKIGGEEMTNQISRLINEVRNSEKLFNEKVQLSGNSG